MAEKNADVKKATEKKPLNWLHISTLCSVAILVGTEFLGAAWAAAWALAGYNHLGPTSTHVLTGIFLLIGAVGLAYFMRIAVQNEQIRT